VLFDHVSPRGGCYDGEIDDGQVGVGGGLGLRMHEGLGQGPVEGDKALAGLAMRHPQVDVEGNVDALVEGGDGPPGGVAKEARGLHEIRARIPLYIVASEMTAAGLLVAE